MVNGWKVTAIVFMILFAFETSIFAWAIVEAYQDQNRLYECVYNICADYPMYEYFDEYDMCQCYENETVVVTKYLGG